MDLDVQYNTLIDHLFGRFVSFQKQGKSAFKPGLETTQYLLEQLGNPHVAYPTIHVAGTNGKGSVVHGIASVLIESGKKIGVYSSPHLVDFRERFRVNGSLASKQWVVDFWKQHQGVFDSVNASFFELTTVMALAYFADQKVDYGIIEVGLGGRLDSTNVIAPELAVITRIGLDHQELLGNTIGEIAQEKAGIIKPGIPVVLGANDEVVRHVVQEKANQVKSTLILSTVQDLNAFFQDQNRSTIQTVFGLPLFQDVSLAAVENGLAKVGENTGFYGRWQKLRPDRNWIADCCHNADGWDQALAYFTSDKPKYWILGFSSDKNPAEFLAQIPERDHVVLVFGFSNRAFSKEQLGSLSGHLKKGSSKICPLEELPEIIQRIDFEGLDLFVGGSVFLLGEVFSKKVLPMFGAY